MKLMYVWTTQPKLFEDILIDNASAVPRQGELVKLVFSEGGKTVEKYLRVAVVEWVIDGQTEKHRGALVYNIVEHSARVYLEHTS